MLGCFNNKQKADLAMGTHAAIQTSYRIRGNTIGGGKEDFWAEAGWTLKTQEPVFQIGACLTG